MEQHIRFCATDLGEQVAYATVGQGPPLVWTPPWVSHLELTWDDPEMRSLFEHLARDYTLIRYDKLGCGLSDRDRTEFTLESEVRPLQAVVDHLKLRRLSLWGASEGGFAAAGYAARYPRRVSHLILYGMWGSSENASPERLQMWDAIQSLVRAQWGIASRTMADIFMPGASAEQLATMAHSQRESATAEMAATLLLMNRSFNVMDLLPTIRVPTLVMHRRGDQVILFDRGREVATRIPNAEFAPLEGNEHLTARGDVQALLRTACDFLARPVGGATSSVIAPRPRAKLDANTEAAYATQLVTILFTDVEGSTSLTQQLGDARARAVLRGHERIVREQLTAHGGREIKVMGDGFMASFASASSALECAIALQQAFAAHNEQATTPIRVRVGLNAGEPIVEDADLFGTAVNLAARVAARAAGGQILATDVVRQLVAGKGFLFSDQGDVALRGYEDPVRLFEVSWHPAD